MMHDPQDPGRRYQATKAAGGALGRAMGANSPQSMGSVFKADPYSTKLRPQGPKIGAGITPDQEAMIRQLMQTANMSQADATLAVLSGQQGLRPG